MEYAGQCLGVGFPGVVVLAADAGSQGVREGVLTAQPLPVKICLQLRRAGLGRFELLRGLGLVQGLPQISRPDPVAGRLVACRSVRQPARRGSPPG